MSVVCKTSFFHDVNALIFLFNTTLNCDFSYRRNGIASLLLKTLIDHLSEFDQKANLKAIYLHVLTSNKAAIHFYERNE